MRQRQELAEAVAKLEKMAAVWALRCSDQCFLPTRVATHGAHSNPLNLEARPESAHAYDHIPGQPLFDTGIRAGALRKNGFDLP
jgi:hypothetical protein